MSFDEHTKAVGGAAGSWARGMFSSSGPFTAGTKWLLPLPCPHQQGVRPPGVRDVPALGSCCPCVVAMRWVDCAAALRIYFASLFYVLGPLRSSTQLPSTFFVLPVFGGPASILDLGPLSNLCFAMVCLPRDGSDSGHLSTTPT